MTVKSSEKQPNIKKSQQLCSMFKLQRHRLPLRHADLSNRLITDYWPFHHARSSVAAITICTAAGLLLVCHLKSGQYLR